MRLWRLVSIWQIWPLSPLHISEVYVIYFMLQKSLVIDVVEARSLATADIGGYSDPFVVLKLGEDKIGSTVYKARTLNPIFDEKFIIDEDIERSNELFAIVYDHDSLSTNDFLGHVKISLEPYKNGSWTDMWYRLMNEDFDKNVRGYVRLRIQYVEAGEVPFNEGKRNFELENIEDEKRKQAKEDSLRRRTMAADQNLIVHRRQIINEAHWEENQEEIRQDIIEARERCVESEAVSMTKKQFLNTIDKKLKKKIKKMDDDEADDYIRTLALQSKIVIVEKL